MFDHGTFCRFGDAQIQYSTIFLRSTQTIVYIFDLTLIFHYNSRCAKTENRATKFNCRKRHHRQMGRQYNLIIRGRSNKSRSLVRQKVGSKLTANQVFPLHGLCICHACFSFCLRMAATSMLRVAKEIRERGQQPQTTIPLRLTKQESKPSIIQQRGRCTVIYMHTEGVNK